MFYVALASAILLSCVLSTSALAKAADLDSFTKTVRTYGLVPSWSARTVALAVVAVELVLALALLVRVELVVASPVTALLLSVFFVATLRAFITGKSKDCGCFGVVYRERIGPRTFSRDSLLIIFALFVALFGTGGPTLLESVKLDSVRAWAVIVASLLALAVSLLAGYKIQRAMPKRVVSHRHNHPVQLDENSGSGRAETVAVRFTD